jgi:anthranilate/para-aminobenzoate synthase component I
MTNTNATVNTDVLAPATMPIIDADAGAGVQPLADRIKSAFDDALAELIEKRDQLYANAIAPLEQEGNQLSKEYDELEARIRALEAILPAEERVIRHEADLLTVSGAANAKQDAKAKMDELKELQHKPVVMRQRLGAIQDRFQSINQKKHNIAKEVFQEWYSECQHVIRSGEHGLFVTMLGGIEASMYEFQTRTGTERSGRTGGLFHQGHIIDLTADGKSAEWQAAHHWYR